jgi:1,4-dihydroxy-2-naphthoyl-CoA hydrolase
MSDLINSQNRGLRAALDIKISEATAYRVVAHMPVGPKVHQSFGLLHGGASVVLAETAASVGGMLHVDQSKERVVGLEINANHLRSVRIGELTAIATPVHIGQRTQVWEIRISDGEENLICISRCTLAVVPIPASPHT